MRYVGIDPSTKTGLVILNAGGEVELEKEIIPTEENDPFRMMEIAMLVIEPIVWGKTFVCIEGFSYGSKGKGVSIQYGIGWMIRSELAKSGFYYNEISPSTVKKFATGKGNIKKDGMVLPIYKRWGFESNSDNIRDAYVLAQIARALDGKDILTNFQKEALKKVKGSDRN